MLKILPPFWFFGFLALGIAAHYLASGTRVFEYPIPLLGIIAVIGGFALTLVASSIFSQENTEILPASPANRVLVTRGPFRFTRNPMYLGMILALLGVALYVGSLPPYLAVIADFVVLNFFFIPFEERKMHRQFRGEYEAYLRRVRRWV